MIIITKKRLDYYAHLLEEAKNEERIAKEAYINADCNDTKACIKYRYEWLTKKGLLEGVKNYILADAFDI